jgi:endo-1,4-beta-xylanase
MRIFITAIFLALTLSLSVSAPCRAQTVIKPLPTELTQAKPVNLLPIDLAKGFTLTDNVNKAEGSIKATFELSGQKEGRPLFKANNPKGSANFTGIYVSWLNAEPVKKGDVILGVFYARALKARQESGEAEGLLYFQKSEGRYDRDFTQAFSVGPDWTRITAPFVAKRDYAPGEAMMAIAFSQLEQTIEISGLELMSFGTRLPLSALPLTKFSYAGRDPDAQWRKEALKRIEEIRTDTITLKVVDKRGRPVSGALVDTQMVRNEFIFGSSVSAERITDKDADAERYRQEIINLFDVTVIENGFKWPRFVQPEYRARAFKALDWLEANGKPVKGHNLAWPGWKWTPEFITSDPEKRKNVVALNDAHIQEILAATKGRLIGWDVVNEPVHELDYYKAGMPREHVAEWFKMAQASDPNLKLTMNDYAMLNRSSSPLMIAEFLEFSRMLKTNGARVDILGVQGHVGQTPRPPQAVLSDLDLLAVDGQEIQITEYDFNTKDDQLLADYTRDFLIALYSHKSVTGFIQWGFWEAEHWKSDSAMFRRDWSEKPNLRVWKDLVRGAWRTRFKASTPQSGTIIAKGHRGLYKAKVSYKGKSVEQDFTLQKGGTLVVIRLK